MAQPPAKRRRGRPRQSSPTGTWIDSDLLTRRVNSIVADRDEREYDGPETYQRLCRLTRRLTGKPLTPEQRDRLRKLARSAKRSVIVRQLLAWRHGVGDRDVRRMAAGLKGKIRPPVKLIYR